MPYTLCTLHCIANYCYYIFAMGGQLRWALCLSGNPPLLFCCCHLVLHMFCCIVENKLLSLLLQLSSRFVSRCGNDSDRRREPKQTRLGATFDHFHVHRPRNSCPRHRVASRRCRTHLFRQDLHRYNYSGRRRGNQPA